MRLWGSCINLVNFCILRVVNKITINYSAHHQVFCVFFNVYLFLKERQSVSGGGAERERQGDTESQAGSRLWIVSTEPDTGLEATNHEIIT